MSTTILAPLPTSAYSAANPDMALWHQGSMPCNPGDYVCVRYANGKVENLRGRDLDWDFSDRPTCPSRVTHWKLIIAVRVYLYEVEVTFTDGTKSELFHLTLSSAADAMYVLKNVFKERGEVRRPKSYLTRCLHSAEA